jgi:cellulose synthase (UDP-forming)
VVGIVLRDQAAIPNFLSTLLKTSQSPEIARLVRVLRETQFSSYRIGNDVYRVGRISHLLRLTLILREFPWLIVMIAVILCFLMAALIRTMLRRRARLRLQGSE